MSEKDILNRPIGIFDSGAGGLTVFSEVVRLLPNEHIVYFGDVGRSPYGIRSKEKIIQFTRQDINFLLEHKVKFIIAACNSASAAALDTVRDEYNIDILGVTEPGAKTAVNSTKNKRVGIIGTAATISSNVYAKEIHKRDKNIKVFSLACPLFVPLVEEGYADKKATKIIAMDYLKTLIDVDIDTLVLGCTHYPLLKKVISNAMGDKVMLVDSAEETARELASILSTRNLINSSPGEVTHKFYISDVPDQFSEIVRQFIGRRINNITRVDITRY
jgi:glutamate racemase